jgi:hypothetical protein
MQITNLELLDTRQEIICDSFALTGVASFEQLMQAVDEYATKFPGHHMLVSLDDLGQAQYTSGHACHTHDLDDTQGHDLSALDPAAFENGEHRGYLSTPSEFFIRAANFEAKARGVDFAKACARGLTIDDDELAELVRIHEDPSEVLEQEAILWAVPLQDPALALCAFPNGYFTCDLDPFENHALARHLQTHYGYQLFGIGACCIGFRRAAPLDAQAAQALGQDIARLYNCSGDRAVSCSRQLAAIVQSRPYLFLKYSETLELRCGA